MDNEVVRLNNREIAQLALSIQDELYSFARGILGDQQDVGDVLNDVYLRLLENPEEERFFDSAKPTTWIYEIVKNRAIDYLSKSKRCLRVGYNKSESIEGYEGDFIIKDNKVLDPIEEVIAREAEKSRPSRVETIRRRIDNILTPLQREVVCLHYFQGSTKNETADRLNLTLVQVKGRIQEARRKIGAELSLKDLVLSA